MYVYEDAAETANPVTRLEQLEADGARLSALPAGLERHAALVELFLDACELAQGLADAEFYARGVDSSSAMGDAAMALVMPLATALHHSWNNGYASELPALAAQCAALRALPLPLTITCKRAEGYAFYTLYPETYLEAARELGADPRLKAIGLRSIGLGLAALVAAAAGADTPVTLRPTGEHFRRELRLDDALRAGLLAGANTASFAIADEGPGLSGSSFGSVIDFLEANGVAERRIHLFPSHVGGPGPEAEEPHRERWWRMPRHLTSFDALFLDPNSDRYLAQWFSDLVGDATEPLQDLSAGNWRRLSYRDTGTLPPAHMQHERRKFLLTTARGTFLVKFAGLGRYGRPKLAQAQALSRAGFTPEPLAFRHGFLLERWEADARPADFTRINRNALVGHLGRYLGFRARQLQVPPESPGASLAKLGEMLSYNAGLAFGSEAETALDRYVATLPGCGPVRRVATDNRLHRWEWIRTGDGRLLKTDALDHCATHDLIGCQDITWDIAGAAVEFGLSDGERETLAARVEQESNIPVDRPLLAYMLPCYLAFQLGSYQMAAEGLDYAPDEAARLGQQAGFYRDQLSRFIAAL